MKSSKAILAALLLSFVAVSIGYVIIKEGGGEAETQSPTPLVSSRGTIQPEAKSKLETSPLESKVVAYYFHGKRRCVTCRNIESYAKEAIETGFPEAIKTGRLEFRAVNVEEVQNEHFIQDYQLSTRSVVIARFKNGKQTDWKNLQLVWELVRDHEAFLLYVQEETKAFLAEGI